MPRKGNIIYSLSVAAAFVILEGAAALMLSHSSSIQNNWLSKGIHGIMGALWGGTESVSNYFRLVGANEELARQNDELMLKLKKYEYVASVMEEDSRPGHFDERFAYIPAAITKAGDSGQHSYLIINKGSEDGVTRYSGIVTDDGTVGIVNAVSRHYSYALAFTNSNMVVSARIGHEGAVGALTWDGRSSLGAVLSEIPQHIAIAQNDTIYTSGYSDIFPPDIPLGTIRNWKVINGATYEINVKLFTDHRQLRYVYVTVPGFREELEEIENR